MPKATRAEIEAARAVVLERDQNTCQRCGANVLYRLASIQHRIPRGAGGSARVWQVSNLALVCGTATTPDSCHNWMEHEDREQAEFDGWLLPKLNADIDTEQEPLLTIHGWITLDNQGGRHPLPAGGGSCMTIGQLELPRSASRNGPHPAQMIIRHCGNAKNHVSHAGLEPFPWGCPGTPDIREAA